MATEAGRGSVLYRDAGVTTLRQQPEGRMLDDRLQTLARTMELVQEVSAEPAAAAR
ncbi:MAG: hypothetical protein Q7R32_04050 [Dehalococcoidia bacterium]|nr:hypothetical protein [Dehalococcoidia bacterium]